MKITDTNIYVVNNGNLLANASITFDNSFVVWVKLCEGSHGMFINFPCHSYDGKDGNKVWKDDAFPITRELREDITDAVVDAYEKAEKSSRTRKRK